LGQAAKHKVRLWTTTLVIVEIVDVLELGFGLSRLQIKEIVFAVLNSDGLELDERDVLVQAVWSFAEGQSSFSEHYHRALHSR
jgi:predicted nucleic-acid-binding protein